MLIVAKEVTNTLFFFIFKYSAEDGAEFSAGSGAKQYFIIQVKRINISPRLITLLLIRVKRLR